MDLAFFGVSLSFRFNRFLWKTPFQWDQDRRRFVFVPGGWRVFYVWYFVIFGVYLVITVGSIAYVFYGQIYHPKPTVKFVYLVQYALAFAAGWLAAALTLLVAFCGEYIVKIMNRSTQLLETLSGARTGKSKKKQTQINLRLFGIPIPALRDRDGKLDTAGVLFCLILFPLPFLSFILAPVSILLAGDDVFQFVIEDMIPVQVLTHPVVNIFLIVFRIGLMWIVIAESLRIFPFLVFLFGIPGQIVTKMVEYFRNINLSAKTSQWIWNKTLKDYTTLRLISLQVEPHLAQIAFILMGVGVLFSVSLNLAAIRFLDSDMPFGYYATFPSWAFVVFVLIYALIPVGINIHENTKTTLTKWEHLIEPKNLQLRKRVQAMKPITVYAGINRFYFYSLDKSVLSTYMMIILDSTVDLLMAIPADSFVSKH